MKSDVSIRDVTFLLLNINIFNFLQLKLSLYTHIFALISVVFVRQDHTSRGYNVAIVFSWSSFFKIKTMVGGESRVIELLENKSRKQLGEPLLEGEDENCTVQDRSFSNFFFQPRTLGKDLLAIEKFGLVQYVSHWTFSMCSLNFSFRLMFSG